MKNRRLSVAMVGIGGYGAVYLRDLFRDEQTEIMQLIAAADPEPARSELIGEVQKRNIPIYPTLEKLLANEKPELVVLSTPPQLHAEQTILALEHGCHVLCEKPIASDPDQVKQMIAARDRAGRLVAIGYQWSFSSAILTLKKDLIGGRFGKAKRFRTVVLWPRNERYYNRNAWAGKKRDAQGRLVLDSPVNNACSHYLHNMFFVQGQQLDQSEMPARVQAELYRANPIENYDTAVIRCSTASGVELLFIASHATQQLQEPVLEYEYDRATIHFGGNFGNKLVARVSDGSTIVYGEPLEADTGAKLRNVCRAIRENRPVACGLEAAASQTACMFAAQQSMPEITDFPSQMLVTTGDIGHRTTYVRNLETILNSCYEKFSLPTELGYDWARPGKIETIDN